MSTLLNTNFKGNNFTLKILEIWEALKHQVKMEKIDLSRKNFDKFLLEG